MWWLLCMWYDWYGNFFERQGKNEFSSSALITERKQLRERHRCILTKPTLSTFVKLCQELAQQCAPPMKHWSHLCHPSRLWCHPGDGGEVSQKSVTPFGRPFSPSSWNEAWPSKPRQSWDSSVQYDVQHPVSPSENWSGRNQFGMARITNFWAFDISILLCLVSANQSVLFFEDGKTKQ